jgi:cysteinyl-tRNA synthetase
MAYHEFGEKFDIHTGGVDLKFPHHENEIAQSSCALGIDVQSTYWMHNEHLLVDGKKMSKSLGNFYTLRDLENKGYDPLAVREVFLRSHYRQQLNFTFESLKAGEVNVRKINDFYSKLDILKANSEEVHVNNIFSEKLKMFSEALEDDLNTAVALSSVYEFIHEFNKLESFSEADISLAKEFMDKTDEVLSLIRLELEVSLEVLELARERQQARESRDWDKSDKLRAEIKSLGYEVKDDKTAKEGFILTKL